MKPNNMNPIHFYIGTYTRNGSVGIYSSTIDPGTGKLTPPVLVAKVPSPSYLARHPKLPILYAASDAKTGVVAYAVSEDNELTKINSQAAGSSWCYVSVTPDARMILVADYGAATVTALSLKEDGAVGEAIFTGQQTGSSVNKDRQQQPHAHCFVPAPDSRFAVSADLGADKIFVYDLTDPANIHPADPPAAVVTPGNGPRHVLFTKDGRYVYVVNELTAGVSLFSYDSASGGLKLLQEVPGLPDDFTDQNTAAEIRMHPNGRLLYTSNRGHDSIAAFSVDPKTARLTPIGFTPCGGKGPRNFAIDPSGKFMVVAHESSNTLSLFQIDAESGKLTDLQSKIEVGAPVCVLF